MSDEKTIRQSLISAFEQLKSQYATIAAMMCDVAALRAVMLENSPEAQVRYQEVFAEQIKKATPTIVSATQLYDDLILALKTDTHLLN